MNDIIRQAPAMAMKNKESLVDKCSCYHCLAEFHVSEVHEWTDNYQTALCPECKVDSVIPCCDVKTLKEIRKHWFDMATNQGNG